MNVVRGVGGGGEETAGRFCTVLNSSHPLDLTYSIYMIVSCGRGLRDENCVHAEVHYKSGWNYVALKL